MMERLPDHEDDILKEELASEGLHGSHYIIPTNSLGYLSRQSFLAFNRALNAKTREHGISSSQWALLRVLWLEDGLMQREISDRLDIKEPTAASTIKSMEAAGFLVRKPDNYDRRVNRVFLTEEAANLFRDILVYVQEINEAARQGVSEEDLETTKRVLKQLADNLA